MAVGIEVLAGGPMTRVEPSEIPRFDVAVPGDPSLAAYLLLAGALVPDSHVGVRAVGVGNSRNGWSTVLSERRFALTATPAADCAGEPCSDVWLRNRSTAQESTEQRTDLGGELAWRSGWRLPAWAALAAVAPGTHRISDLTPRFDGYGGIEACITMLSAFGIDAKSDDGLAIMGGLPQSTTVDCGGDPHIAMAATVLALASDGPTTIIGAQCIVDAFPRFVASLRALGASIAIS